MVNSRILNKKASKAAQTGVSWPFHNRFFATLGLIYSLTLEVKLPNSVFGPLGLIL